MRKAPKSDPRTTAVSKFERAYSVEWLEVICKAVLPKFINLANERYINLKAARIE
jgi:hypothetical protein|tara:strand:- start:217 stop:381 length:165 start_codon:yes stop_codon:yes gene_type:complete